jgi:hypothetical protein
MSIDFEVELAQNAGVSTVALWSYSRAFFEERSETEGPELPQMLLVLPMVLHRRTAVTLHRMQVQSGLMKALLDHPEIPAGLQLRMESLAGRTLDALAFAIGCRLLDRDRADPWPRYTPLGKALPQAIQPTTDDVKQICAAAHRLGRWFAHEDFTMLCTRLRVRI